MQELAEYVHISPRHFIRKFQTEMNEKFTDYLAHIRVQAAIQMLEAGRDVKSIPEAVGYRDEKAFIPCSGGSRAVPCANTSRN